MKGEKLERLRSEGDDIKLLDFRFEKRQFYDSGKEEEVKMLNRLQVFRVNDDIWVEFVVG